MTRSVFLANRLREVLLNGRWIANTNFKEQIEMVSWQQAIQQIEELNTIALLTFHLNYYMVGLLEVFEGGDLTIRDKFSFDLKPITAPEEWTQLKADFLANAEKFAQQVALMPDEKLDAPFVNEKYGTYLRNIEGVIEHTYYHLGQVSLIRKMLY